MKPSFNLAIAEYYNALTVSKNVRLCWLNGKYFVSWFYSDNRLKKLNAEIII